MIEIEADFEETMSYSTLNVNDNGLEGIGYIVKRRVYFVSIHFIHQWRSLQFYVNYEWQ